MATRPEAKKPATRRQRTEDEMRAALSTLDTNEETVKVAPYDPVCDILQDAVEELLMLRQIRADVQAFVTDQQIKLARR